MKHTKNLNLKKISQTGAESEFQGTQALECQSHTQA